MPEANKINRYAMRPELPATYKQRRLYRELSGRVAEAKKGMTRGEIDVLIKKFPAGSIAAVRNTLKGRKRASKYLRALCQALGHGHPDALTRVGAEQFVASRKTAIPAEYKRAKALVRGMTYNTEEAI